MWLIGSITGTSICTHARGEACGISFNKHLKVSCMEDLLSKIASPLAPAEEWQLWLDKQPSTWWPNQAKDWLAIATLYASWFFMIVQMKKYRILYNFHSIAPESMCVYGIYFSQYKFGMWQGWGPKTHCWVQLKSHCQLDLDSTWGFPPVTHPPLTNLNHYSKSRVEPPSADLLPSSTYLILLLHNTTLESKQQASLLEARSTAFGHAQTCSWVGAQWHGRRSR